MRLQALLYLTVFVPVMSCGRGGVGPTLPGETLSGPNDIRSGRDGSPVVAQVSGAGTGLSVTATGYLTLDTINRHRTVYLWPNDAQVSLADTVSFAYGGESNPLARLGDSTSVVTVVASGEILANAQSAAALREGIDILNRSLLASAVALQFVVGGPGQVRADISVDPNDPVFAGASKPAAATYNTRGSNGVITGSRIVILSLAHARMPIVFFHELTHTFGLYHSVHPGPMMAGPGVYGFDDFTESDRVYMRLLRIRQPGTRIGASSATENDRGAVSASSAGSHTDVIVCY